MYVFCYHISCEIKSCVFDNRFDNRVEWTATVRSTGFLRKLNVIFLTYHSQYCIDYLHKGMMLWDAQLLLLLLYVQKMLSGLYSK